MKKGADLIAGDIIWSCEDEEIDHDDFDASESAYRGLVVVHACGKCLFWMDSKIKSVSIGRQVNERDVGMIHVSHTDWIEDRPLRRNESPFSHLTEICPDDEYCETSREALVELAEKEQAYVDRLIRGLDRIAERLSNTAEPANGDADDELDAQ